MKPILRRLAHAPMFTAVTLLTLAIGIGANTAIFSVLNGVLLKPLPYPAADRLVSVWEKAHLEGMHELNASPSTYFTFREENRTFEDIGLWQYDSLNITGTGEPEQVQALDFTDGVLPVLGVQPILGRRFNRQDDSPGIPKTVMLSYGFWQHKFGGDPSIIGRRIMVDGAAAEIIGVLPATFRLMDTHAAMFEPLQLDRAKTFIGNFGYQAIARLKPGVTLAQASADEARMIPMMLNKFAPAPGLSPEMLREAHLEPLVRPLKSDLVGDIGKTLWVLMATIGAVLLIACANVANLMLVRAEGRQHELAIRAAIGAGWSRLARELLLESVTLGIAGGTLGVALAYAALRVLIAAGPANLPRLDEISIDPAVLLFTFTISLVAGLLFGLIPVFKYNGPRLFGALRQGGRHASDGREHRRARNVLVVVQVALALVLLIGSGLMIRTVRAMKQVAPGFTDPAHILTLHLPVAHAQVPKPDQVVRTYNNIADRIAAIPGVTSVGLSDSITMDGSGSGDPIFAADKTYTEGQIPPIRRFKFITPGFFKTMGNPLLVGRDITWTDIYQGRPVVLVSENLARELWRSPSAAIGKQVRENPKGLWREVIGVVGDERDKGVDQPAPTMAYWPMLVHDFWGDAVNVRRYQAIAIRSSRAGSVSLLNEVRRAVWSVNPDLSMTEVATVQQIYDRSMARTAFTLVMLSVAAGMALLLGLVGIYGVISYTVSQRTREIGIRIALGAPQHSVRQMFVRQGLLLTIAGAACGLAGAAALTRLMKTLLFEVSPVDPLTYIGVSLVLVAAALVASYIPAHRATTIEPVEALRVE